VVLGERSVPALVSQIADGENGGVMMNEFPQAFVAAHRRIAAEAGGTDGSGTDSSGTVALNGSEYLALLDDAGVDGDSGPSGKTIKSRESPKRLAPERTSSGPGKGRSRRTSSGHVSIRSSPRVSSRASPRAFHCDWIDLEIDRCSV
jgi:hypothetical protein